MKEHFEKLLDQAKSERAELLTRCREFEQAVERVRLESQRQINHYRTKYTEYKNKMKKANQNIAVLMARIAKTDLHLAAAGERDP